MNIKYITDEKQRSEICNKILRSLPKWFGIESALLDYVKDVAKMETWASYLNDEAIGFISINKHNSTTAEIHVIGINENLHKQGIGQSLIHEAEKYLAMQNFKYLTVKTLSELRQDENYEKTRQFYLAMGFSPVEVFKTLWGEHNPCLFMIKNIEPTSKEVFMEFKSFIDQAWADHATDINLVFSRLSEGEKLITSNENIPVLARLVAHVCGDHLGVWQEGIAKLQSLKMNSHYLNNTESEFSIDRLIATLQLCSSELTQINHFSISDQIRILAQAASMISEKKDLLRAKNYFIQSLEMASHELEKGDPAYRALAVTGHNLACTFEEKVNRSPQETELMILAAQASRKFWEIAGGSSEVASAEYRLSQSYLKASEIEKSFEHAQLSLEVCEVHQCSALDHFFSYEALALAEKARKNNSGYLKAIDKMKLFFEQLSETDKKWCKKTLDQMI